QPVPGTNHVKIRPELLKIFSEQDAAQINIADNSLDFIYSITVLEHIPHPEAVIRNCYRMLKPGGWTFHNIDMRDHRDFNKPLEFLRLSEEEFCSTDEASNRMRISDYNYVFEKCGFEISMIEYYNRIEVVDSQSTDCFSTLLNPYSNLIKDRLDLIDIWVNDSMKNMFHPDFQKYSLNELSCVVANITGWK
ncbi:MAG: class I SAM-dependent methyltransferase, partial [Thermodesulfovibrionia bacterium]|nr:class I SAM-dependent methyltransferase [Thermodesulfovibrionia bacterium]